MHQQIGDAVAKLYRESRAEGGERMGSVDFGGEFSRGPRPFAPFGGENLRFSRVFSIFFGSFLGYW